MTRQLFRSICFSLIAGTMAITAAVPSVGQKAENFSLATVSGTKIQLSDLTAKGPVLLIVLRGYPGYQCPFCQRQVQDYIQKEQSFVDAGVQVVFVYPGPPDVKMRAEEFLSGKRFPESFLMLLDPNYTLANQYGLRWEAANETAYPSTFLIDRQGLVVFQKIAKLHGGRTSASEVIDLLPKKKR